MTPKYTYLPQNRLLTSVIVLGVLSFAILLVLFYFHPQLRIALSQRIPFFSLAVTLAVWIPVVRKSQHATPDLQRFWRFASWSLASSAIALGMSCAVHSLVATALEIAAQGFLVAALLSWPMRSRSWEAARHNILDTCLMSASLVLLLSILVPDAFGGSGWIDGFHVSDVLGLFLVCLGVTGASALAVLMAARTRHCHHWTFTIIAVGILGMVLSYSASLLQVLATGKMVPSLLLLLPQIFGLCVFAGVALGHPKDAGVQISNTGAFAERILLLRLPFVPFLLALFAGMVGAMQGGPISLFQRATGTIMLLCAVARMVLSLRELQRLNNRLERLVDNRTQALMESHRMLSQGERLRNIAQVTGSLAHDFKNTITAIQMDAESLLQALRGRGDPLAHKADRILRSAAASTELVRKLLATGGRAQGKAVPLDLSQAITERRDIIFSQLPDSVDVDISTDGPAHVRLDPASLDRILLNLAANARDAMPQGGRLKVCVQADTGQVSLVVADTGTGMDEETQKRLFEPFFTTKEQQGAGLGLAAVWGLVTQCGGHIEVQSALGQGTTFTVRWPTHL